MKCSVLLGGLNLFFLVLLSFGVSLVAVMCVRRWFKDHAYRYGHDVAQRFHHGSVPRLGGCGMWLGWSVGLVGATALPGFGIPLGIEIDTLTFFHLMVVVSMVVGVGTIEDATQNVSIRWRLVCAGLAGVWAVWALGLTVPRLDLPLLDAWWMSWPWLGMALAVLGITGLTHAFNLIDGYNGLAGTVAIVISLALAHVALQVGDRQLAVLALCLAAATAGFLVWNYPRGLIFAGDGGAYLWGVVIALISIMLVQRHPQVSPWFVLLLLIYPVWETLFSIYRKRARGDSPGMADALHMHQLVYRRLVRYVAHDNEEYKTLMRNNRTTPYLLAFALLSVIPAVLFWNRTWVLMVFVFLFAVSYVTVYLMIVRFQVPAWVRR